MPRLLKFVQNFWRISIILRLHVILVSPSRTFILCKWNLCQRQWSSIVLLQKWWTVNGCGLKRIRKFSFWSIAKITEKVWAGYFLDFYELEYHGTTLTYFWFELVYHKKYYSFKKVQFISNFYKIPLKNHNPNPCAFVPSDLNFRMDFT